MPFTPCVAMQCANLERLSFDTAITGILLRGHEAIVLKNILHLVGTMNVLSDHFYGGWSCTVKLLYRSATRPTRSAPSFTFYPLLHLRGDE